MSDDLKTVAAPGRRTAPARAEIDPLRRDLARLLDNLYGLHFRSGHLDAVLDVVHLHAPVKIPLGEAAHADAARPLRDYVQHKAGCAARSIRLDNRKPCTCGLDAALSALPLARPQIDDEDKAACLPVQGTPLTENQPPEMDGQ